MQSYTRKQSNDLATCERIAELRKLQSHLSSVIQNENDEGAPRALDSSVHSNASSASVHSSASLSIGDVESGLPSSQSASKGPSSPPNNRRASNDLGASERIAELRQLQSQLSSVIQDKNDDIPASGLNNSNHSQSSRLTNSMHGSSHGTSTNPRIILSRGSDSESDAGGLPKVYKPAPRVKIAPSSETLVTTMTGNSATTLGETKSDDTSGKNQTAPSPAVDMVPIEENKSFRGRIAARTKSLRLGGGRSRSRDRSIKSNDSNLSTSRRAAILTQMRRSKKNDSAIDDVEKQSLTGRLPKYEFLMESDKERGSLKAGHKWWHAVFILSLISFLACIITLWAPYPIGARMPSSEVAKMPWSNGCIGVATCICPRETICADDLISMIFLTIARASAWFDYPLYMLLFLTKCANLNNFLQTTAARCWINFSDSHRVHSLFGIIVAIETSSHTFFHLLRWARRMDDIQFLWTTKTGITGLIAFSLTPLITLPMAVPFLKNRMKFEWRKGLHYLAYVWAAALMCHAPQRIFWLIGVPFFVYAADYIVGCLFKCHLVESAYFQRLGDASCLIEFENPEGFGKQNSAYVYLMLPWISKTQFHAFTVFPGNKPDHSSVCIHQAGDWTGELMKQITIPAHKPAFVVGPFLSPFSSPAMDSEFLVAVASGIGVTPAISLIKQYSHTSRRLNLVWICRDAGLVEHFLQNVEFSSDGYSLIYYTGKRSIILPDKKLPSNVFLFNGRPNLEKSISGIIHSIVSGEGLPEELSAKVVTSTPADMRAKLLVEKALSLYSVDQLFDYSLKASNYYNESQEPLTNEINYQGVLSTMRHLLANDYDVDSITQIFERVDRDGNCRLNRVEFEDFMHLLLQGGCNEEIQTVKRNLTKMTTVRNIFESQQKKSSTMDEFGIRKHLHGGDGKYSAKNWSMLYCGGSAPVLSQLKDYKKKFGIHLSVEKFDW
mmetsp:Transcript_19390/g.27622  ORF Transcript_19390/g.27622 Transcript_19390/m.27622 type:complete len:950 (+) Transcript_19390:61-2910(+)